MKPQFILDIETSLSANLLTLVPDSAKTALLLEDCSKKIPGSNALQIPFQKSFECFNLIASKAELIFNKKPLIIDLYSRSEFFYRVVKVSGKPSIDGWIKRKDTEVPLKECLFAGPGDPLWYIQGMTLRFIETDLSWKDFKRAFQEPQALKIDELQELIDDPEPLSPRVVFDGNASLTSDAILEPLPLLALTERTGAFANLKMQYEVEEVYHLLSYPADRLQKCPFKRNEAAEKSWEKDLLETGYIHKPTGNSTYYCSMESVPKTLSFLLDLGWKVIDAKNNLVLKRSAFHLKANSKASSISLSGEMCFDKHIASLSDVVGAFNRKERFIELENGKVGLLEAKELAGIADEIEIEGGEVRLARHSLGTLESFIKEMKGELDLDTPLQNLRQRLLEKTIENPSASEKPFNETFKGELRPYQVQGVNWLNSLLHFNLHGLLADDMGLGKTVQTLAFLSNLPLTASILVIMPRSLIFNWEAECKKFLPSKKIQVHHGAKREMSYESFAQKIVLTTYATLRSDLSILEKVQWDCVILDEAQQVKNSSTLTAKSLLRLKANFRLSITGTPVENHPMELWSQFRFLLPDLLGDQESFEAKLSAANFDPRYLEQIRRKISPFILRRKKEEVAKDLPPKIEQIVYIEMEEQERQFYEDFLASVKSGLVEKIKADGVSKHRMEVFEAILRLRQICCHPLLLSSQCETDPLESQKLKELFEEIETVLEEKSKVLVYSQFTQMLSLMKKQADEKGWKYAHLDGQTKDRQKQVDLFQNDPGTQIFFVSLKAGGVGLNLTAADYVFLYDPWWNLAVENQAIDRAHRIGQQKTVIAKRYIVKESIEEKMMIIKEKKRQSALALLDESAMQEALTEDDLRFLLEF